MLPYEHLTKKLLISFIKDVQKTMLNFKDVLGFGQIYRNSQRTLSLKISI